MLTVVVIGWAVEKRPYWKSVALALGFGWGSEVAGGIARTVTGIGWANVGEDRMAFYVANVSIVNLVVSMGFGLLALIGPGLRGWFR